MGRGPFQKKKQLGRQKNFGLRKNPKFGRRRPLPKGASFYRKLYFPTDLISKVFQREALCDVVFWPVESTIKMKEPGGGGVARKRYRKIYES